MKAKKRLSKAKADPITVEIEGFYYDRAANGKLVIEGHQLDATQEQVFIQKIRERRAIAHRPGSDIREPEEYAHDTALSDLLHKYRHRPKAKDQLLRLAMRVSDAVHSISSMRGYSFFQQDVSADHACELVQKLVGEAERHLAKLRFYADSMALEPSTKLHHWTARAEKLQRM